MSETRTRPVEHMVCPACSQVFGRQHREGCPFNDGLTHFRSEIDAYREQLIATLTAEGPERD